MEPYIKEAIDSALAQTWQNFELIVADDASTDRTGEIIKSYADPRIKYLFYGHNRGIVGSRNHLLREAKGEFLTWLDADDVYLPDKVKGEVEFLLAHPEYASVYCKMLYFFDGAPDKFYRHVYEHYSGDIFGELLEKMFITNTAFMFRRSVYDALGGFNPATGMVEDWEYFLRMAHHGMQFGYLDVDLVKYRLRWNSNTNFARQVEIKRSQVKIFENLKERMTPEERERWNVDRWVAKRKENLAIALFSAGRKKEAMAICAEIKNRMSFKRKIMIFAMAIVPSTVLAFFIERAWNWRKRHLFVPVA
jgi:glycosyltransferase involved in cell wall biosynthesis